VLEGLGHARYSGELLRQYGQPGEGRKVFGLGFTPDGNSVIAGRSILSVSTDRTMRRWTLRSIAELLSFINTERYVNLPSPAEQQRLETDTGIDLYDT